MSSSKRSEMPPPYNEATNQNDQLMLTYENQNNQYPGGNQFSSPGGGPYPVSQHQSQCTPQDQVMRPLVKQPGANVITRDPNTINWMVPAVLACLCCFWPAGIVAIHYASKLLPPEIFEFRQKHHIITHIIHLLSTDLPDKDNEHTEGLTGQQMMLTTAWLMKQQQMVM
nr:uncharacterized protein LOC105346096 isoform X2 [Crassostrea gigas]